MSAESGTKSLAPTYEKLLFVYDKVIRHKCGLDSSLDVDAQYSNEFFAFLHEISFLMPLHYGLYDRIVHAGYFLSATLQALKTGKKCSPLSAFLIQVAKMYRTVPVTVDNEILCAYLDCMARLVQQHDTRHQHELLSVLLLEQRETKFPTELQSFQAQILEIFQVNYGERPDLAESGFNFLICSHLVIFYYFWAKLNGLRIREFVAESELWQLELVLHEWISEVHGMSGEHVDNGLLSCLKDLEESLTHVNGTEGWYTKKTVVSMKCILKQLQAKASLMEGKEGNLGNAYECYLYYKYKKSVKLTDTANGTIVTLDKFLCDCMFEIQNFASPGPYKIILPPENNTVLKHPFNIFDAMESSNEFEFALSLPWFCNGSNSWKQTLRENVGKYVGICQYEKAEQQGKSDFFFMGNVQDAITRDLSEVTKQMIHVSYDVIMQTFPYTLPKRARLKDLNPLFSIANEWTNKDKKGSQDLLRKLEEVENYYECFSTRDQGGLKDSKEMRAKIRPILHDYVELIQATVNDQNDRQHTINNLETTVSTLRSGADTAALHASVKQLEQENAKLKKDAERLSNELIDAKAVRDTSLESLQRDKSGNDAIRAQNLSLENQLQICQQESNEYKTQCAKIESELLSKKTQCENLLENVNTLRTWLNQTTGGHQTDVGVMETSVENAIDELRNAKEEFQTRLVKKDADLYKVQDELKVAKKDLEDATHKLSECNERCTNMESDLRSKTTELQKRLDEKDTDLQKVQDQLNDAKKDLNEAKHAISEKESEIQECRVLNGQIAKLKAEVEVLQANVAERDATMNEIEQKLTLCTNNLAESQKDLRRKADEFEQVLKIFSNRPDGSHLFDIEAINNEIDGLEEEFKTEIDQIMRQHNSAFTAVQDTIKETEAVVSSLQVNVDTLTHNFEVCHKLNGDLTADNASKTQKILDLEAHFEEKDVEMKKVVKDVCEEHQKLNEQQKEKFNRAIAITKKKIHALTGVNLETQKAKENLESMLEKQQQSVNVLETEYSELKRVYDTQEHTLQTIKQLESLRTQSVIDNDQFEQCQQYVQELHALQQDYNESMQENDTLRDTIRTQNEEINTLESKIKTFERLNSNFVDRLEGAWQSSVLLDDELDSVTQAKDDVQMMVNLMTDFWKKEKKKNETYVQENTKLEETFNHNVRELQEKVKQCQEDHEKNAQTFKSANEALQTQLKECQNARTELEIKLADCQNARTELETQLQKCLNAQNDLRIENEKLVAKVKKCQEDHANDAQTFKSANEALQTQLEECQNARTQLETKLADCLNAQNDLRTENEKLVAEVKKCEHKNTTLKAAKTDSENKLKACREAQNRLQSVVDALKNDSSAKARDAENNAKAYNSSLQDKDTEIKKLTEKLEASNENLTELTSEHEKCKRVMQQYHEATIDLDGDDGIQQQVQDFENAIKQRNKELLESVFDIMHALIMLPEEDLRELQSSTVSVRGVCRMILKSLRRNPQVLNQGTSTIQLLNNILLTDGGGRGPEDGDEGRDDDQDARRSSQRGVRQRTFYRAHPTDADDPWEQHAARYERHMSGDFTIGDKNSRIFANRNRHSR